MGGVRGYHSPKPTGRGAQLISTRATRAFPVPPRCRTGFTPLSLGGKSRTRVGCGCSPAALATAVARQGAPEGHFASLGRGGGGKVSGTAVLHP